jgi:RNA polymerase sigma factor for flagellar operon FliA
MIMEFLPLVKSVATRLASRFPSHVDVDDLINIGSLGLIEAIDRFDPLRCESFKAYAELRIRGAILDEIRVQDWMPRSVRHRVQELERARRRLLNRLGRAPSEREVADEMGLALEDVQAIQQSAANQSMLSLDELGVRDDSRRDIHEVIPGDSEDALTMLVGRCNTERLAQAIGALPDRE